MNLEILVSMTLIVISAFGAVFYGWNVYRCKKSVTRKIKRAASIIFAATAAREIVSLFIDGHSLSAFGEWNMLLVVTIAVGFGLASPNEADGCD